MSSLKTSLLQSNERHRSPLYAPPNHVPEWARLDRVIRTVYRRSLFIECLISLVQSSPHLVQISSPSSARVNICCTNGIKVLSATINSRSLHASSSNCKSILNPESIYKEIQRPTEPTHGLKSVPSKPYNAFVPVDPRVRLPTSGCAMP